MKSATLKDVADMACVSVSTASRVLNNNYPVSNEVRERVLEVVKLLGYMPNSAARSLKTNKTDTIGLVVADISNLFFMRIAKGIENAIMPLGYNIIIASSDGDKNKEKKLLMMLLEKRVAALIIASSGRSGTYLQNFEAVGIPIILIDRMVRDIKADFVMEQDQEIARRLTRILFDAGHTNIAAANVNFSASPGLLRYEGFMEAHRECGIRPVSKYISGSNFEQEEAYQWVKKVFSTDHPPSAIFCANNIMTTATLLAFQEMSIKVPEDVSIVSFGELEMQPLIPLKITCSVQDAFGMGTIAGELALRRIEEGNAFPLAETYMDITIAERNSVMVLNGVH